MCWQIFCRSRILSTFLIAFIVIAASLLIVHPSWAISGFALQDEIPSVNPALTDWFGAAGLTIDGDTAVVGDPFDDIAAPAGTIVDAGAVYVYTRSGSTWTMQQTLTASDKGVNDNFGFDVAIEGDTLVVGTSGENAVYVFNRTGSTWTQIAKLTPSDGLLHRQFGAAVDISGDTIVTSDFSMGGNLPPEPERAYVFVRPGAVWTDMTETAVLRATDVTGGEGFGDGVAVDGDTVVVARTITVSAYVFVRPTGGWTGTLFEDAKLTPSIAGDTGNSTDIDGDTIILGRAATGTVAYIFVKSGSAWVSTNETAQLSVTGNVFSSRVVLDGVTAVATVGTNTAYVFERPSSGWDFMLPTETLTPNGYFLQSAAINGDTALVGGTLAGVGRVFAYVGTGADPLDLDVSKADDTDPVEAGTDLTYTILVTNNGPGDATGVTVTDTLPTGMTFNSSLPAGICSAIGDTITCDVGNLADGANTLVDLNVTAPGSAGIITNIVGVSFNEPGSTDSTSEDTTVVLPGIDVTDSVLPADDLQISFGFVPVLNSVSATVTMANTGTISAEIGTVAGAADPVSLPFSITNDGCSNQTLAPQGSPGAQCTFKVQFAPTVEAVFSDTFAIPIGTTSSVSMAVDGHSVPPGADLDIILFTRQNQDDPPQNIFLSLYRISIRNNGPTDAEGFVLDLDLPHRAENPRILAGDAIGDLLLCTDTITDLATGEHRFHCVLPSPNVMAAAATAKIVVEVDRTGNLGESTATVSATTHDPDSSNNLRRTDAVGSSTGSKGCFFGETIYGPNHPHLKDLRRFRDRYMMSNGPGRKFAAWYYKISPTASAFFAEHESLKPAARVLFTPVIYLARYPGPAGLLAIAGLFFVGYAGSRRRRKKKRPIESAITGRPWVPDYEF
jgi:uncharacterized repeat protein (TIGR01451 family)